MVVVMGCLLEGCWQARETSGVTITQIRALEAFDALLPVGPDSVLELYRRDDPASFQRKFQLQLVAVSMLIDSLNAFLDIRSRIDTLAIDHSFDGFGEAACSGHSIYLSISYFLLYNDPSVLRSVITHEFGHVVYRQLSGEQQATFEKLWVQLGNAALLYLFRDGEYSGNPRFGGHPYESPAELFASAFNLLCNRPQELATRLQYVDEKHYPLINSLRRVVETNARIR